MSSVFVERILWFGCFVVTDCAFVFMINACIFTRNNNVNALFSNPEIPGFGLS